MTYEDLTDNQKALHDRLSHQSSQDGSDLRDLTLAADAPAEDKAAVAEVFGGDGAGAEFLR